MELKKLFDMQRVLDERIIEEKGLKGQHLLSDKILALQVELGELANEHRGFKFWSENREPRVKALRSPAMMEEDKEYYNPMLEEYVDCLHFILSIVNDFDMSESHFLKSTKLYISITDHFNDLFRLINKLNSKNTLAVLIMRFLSLGERLGFTWEQILSAYLEKNAINHLRQSTSY